MTLRPGQTGGLDSENGDAINVTCTEDAAAVIVDIGARDELADMQAANLPALVGGPQ
jgi:hypothetical protein